MKKRDLLETEFNEHIANLIRTKRKELGLNQTEVAKLLGLTQGAFSRKETCKRKISLTEFVIFAKKYAPDITKLLGLLLIPTGYIM